jgi:hypothetical protein
MFKRQQQKQQQQQEQHKQKYLIQCSSKVLKA